MIRTNPPLTLKLTHSYISQLLFLHIIPILHKWHTIYVCIYCTSAKHTADVKWLLSLNVGDPLFSVHVHYENIMHTDTLNKIIINF